MLKIINNNALTENEFWCAPISTTEQAIQIIRRVSRDFIGLCIVELPFFGFMALTSDAPLNLLPIAIFLSVWVGLAIWVGRKSYAAALIVAVLTTLPTIGLIAVSITAIFNTPKIISILPSILPLCFALAMSWMAWRAFKATRRLYV